MRESSRRGRGRVRDQLLRQADNRNQTSARLMLICSDGDLSQGRALSRRISSAFGTPTARRSTELQANCRPAQNLRWSTRVPSEFSPALDLVLSRTRTDAGARRKIPARLARFADPAATPRFRSERAATAARQSRRCPDKAARLAPIQARVAVCVKCPHLAATRTQTVFGVGNPGCGSDVHRRSARRR